MATCTTSTYLSSYTLFPIAPKKHIQEQSEMEQGFKHFSHSHNLIIHQLPEGIEVLCSGCNSSGTETVYVCWHCNFFLHEQCYRATRSLKHPSHPSHPLTLVPYPTYPSNSFYCNSCKIIGTGISYSCADCDFDLHVQCAYSISAATSFQKTHQYQEVVQPGWNISLQNSNMTHNLPFVSVPADSLSILPPNSFPRYHPMSHGLVYDSIPPDHQNSIQDRPMAQNGPSASIHQSFESGESHLKDKEGILHFSHPHSLSIINLQEDDKNEVICSGCEKGLLGKGYSCAEPDCNFQLHESCVSLPETVKRPDHDHTLQLFYSCPVHVKGEEYSITCDVCRGAVQKDRWGYYCKSCDYCTHLGCVNCEARKEESVLDVQVELQRMQLQMEMARQHAQLIASIGSSVASLV